MLSEESLIKKPASVSILGVPLYLYAVSLASLLTIIGVIWDISWHMTIGRDKLLSPPHLLIYMGAILGGLFSGIQVLWNTFGSKGETKKRLVKVWGVFYSSLGAMFCIWGAVAMLTSAPFDDWWHNTYGLDIVVLSPPHALLILGMLFLQMGACISVIKYMNLQKASEESIEPKHKRKLILQLLLIVAAASLLCMICTFLKAPLSARNQRSFIFYGIAAASVLFFLPAFGRTLRMKLGITSVTLGYFFIACITNWILQLFPAEPLLGPILNPVTHFQPLQFPILFFVPAIAMDLVMQRVKKNDWIKAVLLSSIFVLGLFAVQYPFSGFLVESPASRNWFFGSESLYYGIDPNLAYRYKFMKQEFQSFPALLRALGFAFLIGIITTRISLRWGKWMNSIVR